MPFLGGGFIGKRAIEICLRGGNWLNKCGKRKESLHSYRERRAEFEKAFARLCKRQRGNSRRSIISRRGKRKTCSGSIVLETPSEGGE